MSHKKQNLIKVNSPLGNGKEVESRVNRSHSLARAYLFDLILPLQFNDQRKAIRSHKVSRAVSILTNDIFTLFLFNSFSNETYSHQISSAPIQKT